jgi:tetratricopeptide (TPR) repeat protein
MTFNKAKALRQAEKHVQQGKINAAIEDYTKIAEFDPSDLTVVNTLGDLLVRAGRVEEAILNFQKIAESYRENGFTLKAIAMFKKISKLNPQNVDVSLKLASLYSQQGLLVEARQQYLLVADAYARGGKTQKALDVYQKIADLDPENTSVRIKLAETYLRENMREQAHDAYIAAGTELIRKNRVDQGLDACLQALAVNPESKVGLSAVSEAYIHRGEPKRAIDLLIEAFDKNPGDVDLITILGKTYLAAGMMDEAESTFMSLVQLDKSRFEYVLDVGRFFADHGQLDRAAEQLDACVDILISRREEDRAIDFLHQLLDKDVNHVASLQRLADIYQRIREDHNLVNTLESLVEAAVRSGKTPEAIEALKQLVRLEPENPAHRQRLQSLGVKTEEISPVPTGPFAPGRRMAPGAEEIDPSVARDLSDAERMARGGDNTSAILILEELVERVPDSVEARENLRQLYTAERMEDRASEQCVELARLYKSKGDFSRAREMEELSDALAPRKGFGFDVPSPLGKRAFELDFGEAEPEPPPSVDAATDFDLTPSSDLGNPFDIFGQSSDADLTTAQQPSPSGGSTVESGPIMSDAALRDELEGVDFYIAQGYLEIARDTLDRLTASFPEHPDIQRRYQKLRSTAELKAQMERIGTGEITEAAGEDEEAPAADSEFDLSSMFTIEAVEAEVEQEADPFPRPEPAEVDDDAFDIRNVPSPFSTSELPSLDESDEEAEAVEVEEPATAQDEGAFEVAAVSSTFEVSYEPVAEEAEAGGFDVPLEQEVPSYSVELEEPEPELEPEPEPEPFAEPEITAEIESESEPELVEESEPEPATEPVAEVVEEEEEEPAPRDAELLDDLLHTLDTNFDAIDQKKIPATGPIRLGEPIAPAVAQPAAATSAESLDTGLQDIFEEFKSSFETDSGQDFDTHYNLGIAYRDMELLDDAIEEFQAAIRTTSPTGADGRYIQCCNMLGLCFMSKDMPRLAVMWFRKGLDAPNRPEDEYQALRFDLGLAYERLGDVEKAIDVFSEVYAIDIHYRDVGEKLRELQATKKNT